jgi:drug/metabolite transporter (DMT)-like permease
MSSYAVLGKILVAEMSPLLVIALAQVLSVLTILFFFGCFHELKQVMSLPPQDLWWIFVMALLSSVIGPILFYTGLIKATATDATLLASLESVFTGIIAFLWLKETMTREQLAGIVFMFFGVAIIASQNFTLGITSNPGNILIILGCVSWGLGTNVFKRFISHIKPEVVVAFRNAIAAIVILFFIPILFGIEHDIKSALRWEILIPLFLYAFLTKACAQLFWYKSLEMIPATLATSIMLILPFFAIVLVLIFLKETLYLYHLSGGMFVIAGLILTVFHQQKHPEHALHQKVKNDV